MTKISEWQEIIFHNPLYIGLLIITMWIVVLISVSKITGWSRLAEKYRTWDKPESNIMRAVRAYWGSVMITGNIYTIACNSKGMYLGVLFPFRLAHPPLLIPWHDIKTSRIKGLLNRRVRMVFGDNLSRPFEVFESTAVKIEKCSHGKFSY